MTRFLDIQLFIYYAIILSSIQRSEEVKVETESENEPLEAVESRYLPRRDYQGHYGEREYRRRTTDLPVRFQAPTADSMDFWRYREGPQRRRDSDRRTFLEDPRYYPYENKNPYSGLNGFYRMMSHFFRWDDDYPKPTREPYPFEFPKPQHDPYPYELPYNFRPTEPTILPPPKPVRASIVKLEQITHAPELYPPLDHTTTAKYYPQFVNLLNQVILENMRKSHEDELGFHDPYHDPVINFRPKPVLAKPNSFKSHVHDNIIPTTYKPISNHKNKKNKYPGSIQDQLPPLKNGENAQIPYVSATTINHPPTTEKNPEATSPIDPRLGNTDTVVFPTDSPTTGNTISDIDIRILNDLKATTTSLPIDVEHVTVPQLTTTTVEKPELGNNTDVEILTGDSTEAYKVIRPPPKKTSRSKKVSPNSVNGSVEIITNLTVKGLSKNQNQNVNIPRYVNHINMSNLINYEIDKLLQSQPLEPRADLQQESTEDRATVRTTPKWKHVFDINDELSLDVKILKDTNWDGFTVTDLPTTTESIIVTTLTEERKPTTKKKPIVVETRVTKSVTKVVGPADEKEFIPKKPQVFRRKSFDRPTTSVPTTTESVEINTILETRSPIETFESTRAEVLSTTEKEIRRRVGVAITTENEVMENIPLMRRMERPNFDETFDIASFITTTPAYPRRKYHRRPKVKEFTQYPSVTEKQENTKFGGLSRPSFPKRQKPNITFSYGSRKVKLENNNTFKGEIMKFSDDDLKKSEDKKERRYQYKKRRYPPYRKSHTTEQSTTTEAKNN